MVASQGLHNALKLPDKDKVAQICNFLGGEVCDAAALVFDLAFWSSCLLHFKELEPTKYTIGCWVMLTS